MFITDSRYEFYNLSSYMPTSNFYTAIKLYRLDTDFIDYLVRL